MSRLVRTASLAVALLACIGAEAAWADYGPGAVPVSASGNQLGDRDSHSPLLSADGRYVVFATDSALLLGPASRPDQFNASGALRRNLLTGEIEPVAPPVRKWRSDGTVVADGPQGVGVSSISADGRYVLIETTSRLAPGDTNVATRDVYVRDMTKPVSDQTGSSYELVSAVDGMERTPEYRDAALGSAAGETGFALSDDGRTAVFYTAGEATLPAGGEQFAPKWQVFVRSLDTRTTRLVTRDLQDPGLPGTPVAPGTSNQVRAPAPQLSGDGTTVVWAASNAGRQTRFLPGEPEHLMHYLWRDMAAGPAAPVRRITGASDPDDPGCSEDSPYVDSRTAEGPCYGPFAWPITMGQSFSSTQVELGSLSISDDGLRVLIQTGAALRPFSDATHRKGALYVADMSPGVSRKQGTVRIVSVPNSANDAQRGFQDGPVLSGNGRYVAFASRNNVFDGPQPLGTFQTGELDTINAFVLDLAAGTVERVTRTPSGGDYRGPIPPGSPDGRPIEPALGSLTISDDGSVVAFSAGDGNLFVGDANDATDVQVVRRSAPSSSSGGGTGGGPPDPSLPDIGGPRVFPLLPIHPLIGYVRLTARGVALLTVRVPAPGRLTGSATGRPAGRRGRLTVGRDSARPKRAATVTLRIRPSRAARRALRRRPHRVPVTLRVRYRPARGPATSAVRRYTLRRGGNR
jgi:hypothetical protein